MRILPCFLLLFGACNNLERTMPDLAGTCAPEEPPTCDGNAVKVCRGDGSGYDYASCARGCMNGLCTCDPGSFFCQGSVVMGCGVDRLPKADHTCGTGTVCNEGRCDEVRCPDEIAPAGSGEFSLPVNAWPRFRHNNRNSGWTPTVVADQPSLKWKIFVGGSPNASGGLSSGPVVNQSNRIFVTGGKMDPQGGSLHSYDSDGKEIYFFPADIPYDLSTPAVRGDGTAYFSGRKLYAVDPMGMERWSYMPMLAADSNPVVTRDGTVIYGSDDYVLYALDPTGALVWKTDPKDGPGEIDGGITQTCDDKLYVGGQHGWFALDAKTGQTLWRVPTMGIFGASNSSPVVTADGTLYGFDSGGYGYAIDGAGQVLWTKRVVQYGGGGGSTAKVEDRLFSVLTDGLLHAVDAATGADLWTQSVGDQVTFIVSGPIVDGNRRLYVNGSDGFLHAFSTDGAVLWKLPTSGKTITTTITATPAIGNDGTIYVPGNDGYLYAFQ